MNKAKSSPLIVLAVALVTVAAVGSAASQPATPAQDQGTIERSFDVDPGGTLEVDTSFGSIEVTTSNSNRVEITVEREVRDRYEDDAARILGEHTVEINQVGDGVTVRAELDEDVRDRWNDDYRSTPLRVRFEVRVPRAYNVTLDTSGGSISVADIEGEIRADTSGGSLSFGNVGGSVRGHTSGGSISIGEVDGTVDVDTSGGSITIERGGGEVRASTSGGSIEVNEVAGMIEASTSGGSIRATITDQPGGDCRLSTSGGSITVTLAPDLALDIDASSGGGGRVSSDVEISGDVSRRSIRGTMNGGGPELRLRTSGGGVRIRQS